ncbi:MAG TPA: carboxypeptidase-like regulatory domain-containing protein [Sphingobacteriaceae bacterium]|nr:carboxypeptidase-like regulatory domain-containing protein [Sphingobacteriaceae bacterium]
MEKIYTSKKKTLILGVMCFLCSIVFQQNLMAQNNRYVIKGKVVDMRTGQSLPGVSVKLGNSVLGASTDVNGNYQLGADLSPGVYAITFNFISYKPETRSVTLGTDNNVTLNISLSEDFVSLNEVVVTGTSVATSKRQLGNAISTVSSRDIESSAAISVDQA